MTPPTLPKGPAPGPAGTGCPGPGARRSSHPSLSVTDGNLHSPTSRRPDQPAVAATAARTKET